MDNFFLRGMRWLNDRQEEYSAVPIHYDNGDSVREALAVVGRIAQEETDNGIARLADVNSFLFDFIIKVKFLAGTPKAGDRITCGGKRYEVVNQYDGRCFNYVDNTFEVVRIHAQLITGE